MLIDKRTSRRIVIFVCIAIVVIQNFGFTLGMRLPAYIMAPIVAGALISLFLVLYLPRLKAEKTRSRLVDQKSRRKELLATCIIAYLIGGLGVWSLYTKSYSSETYPPREGFIAVPDSVRFGFLISQICLSFAAGPVFWKFPNVGNTLFLAMFVLLILNIVIGHMLPIESCGQISLKFC